MITDDDVTKMYQRCQNMRQLIMNKQDSLAHDGAYFIEIFRGTAPHLKDMHPGSCTRHKSVFNQYNIIPRDCFNCYKILIQPGTVMELFKLVMLFHKIRLAQDNVRKCTVESRRDVAGMYKGLVYCDGPEQADRTLDTMSKAVAREISRDIPISLKRGCSEYAPAYPEFPVVDDKKNIMEYRNEWHEYEQLADEKFDSNTQSMEHGTFNRDSFSIEEIRVMHIWLKYAATLGDMSYMKISGCVEEPIQNLERPSTFRP